MKSSSAPKGYNFGTFRGVFVPSILTILGVIMYLRFGWTIGNVGIVGTLIIVLMSVAITLITSLSLSSLATNRHVGRGGAYFIVSDTLGVEAGAAIGLPLFAAQALGVAFYIAGFSESVAVFFPEFTPEQIGLVVLAITTVIAYFSADLALKLQYVVLIAIAVSLVSFFAGSSEGVPVEVTLETLPTRLGFWAVFAVFFPGVTGILTGVSMSGDLKNPARSLPVGTIGAVLVGLLIYLAIPIFLWSLDLSDEVLLSNSLIMADVARWGEAIMLGLWGASLSSAMGSLLSGSRTLQALANDGALPKVIGRGFGKNNDPRVATLLVFVIALGGIFLGGLNVIATLLTMFFLTAYGMLNLSAWVQEILSGPLWRPRFRTPAKLSMFGALACLTAMLMIDVGAAIIATIVIFLVYYVMKRRSLVARYGDVLSGFLLYLINLGISLLVAVKPELQNWMPNILALLLKANLIPKSGEMWLAALFAGKRSLVTAGVVIGHSIEEGRLSDLTQLIRGQLQKQGIQALVKIVRADNYAVGMNDLVRAYGYGPLVPNTVLVGHVDVSEVSTQYVDVLRAVMAMKRNLIVLRGCIERPNFEEGSRIDIWWKLKGKNAGLMLALANQLLRARGQSNVRLVIKTIVEPGDVDPDIARKRLEEFIQRERLQAEAEIVESAGRNVFEAIRASSEGASLVFLGMRGPQEGEAAAAYFSYYTKLLKHLDKLPPTAVVFAGEELDFRRMYRTTRRL